VFVVSMTRVARARSGERPLGPAAALGRERMRATRLAEAMQDGLVARVEKEHVQVALAAGLQQLQDVAHFTQECPYADVDSQREAGHLTAFTKGDRLRSEERRQVVDAEEAQILEGVKRLRLSRARNAADDDDRRPRRRAPVGEAALVHSSLSLRGGTIGTHEELSVPPALGTSDDHVVGLIRSDSARPSVLDGAPLGNLDRAATDGGVALSIVGS
jgi:hypothetical protein